MDSFPPLGYGQTAAEMSASYSKVGNIVNFNLSIVTSASTLTGPIQVGGLPIVSAGTLSAIFVIQCIGITRRVVITSFTANSQEEAHPLRYGAEARLPQLKCRDLRSQRRRRRRLTSPEVIRRQANIKD
jgi:hypothetical protein